MVDDYKYHSGPNLVDILGAFMEKDKYEIHLLVQSDVADMMDRGEKINPIKALRNYTGFGLLESKRVIESIMLGRLPGNFNQHLVIIRVNAQTFADFMMKWYNNTSNADFLLDTVKMWVPVPTETITRITL